MHVNPEVIRSNSGIYNTHATAQDKARAVDKAPVTTDKMAGNTKKSAKEDDFSFWDLVDIVNPLQHIPVVNTIYREITGDKINSFGQIAGGAIFGGFIGAAIGGINAIVKHDTGSDLTEMAMVKAGFRPSPPKHEPIEMVPVIDKNANDAKSSIQDRATLDTIIWDAPSLLQLATKETIIWDTPIRDTPSHAIIAQNIPAQKTQIKTDETVKIPAHIVRDVPQDAYQMAAAMPDPASLNDIEPGSPSSPLPSPLPQAMDGSNVHDNMMQALAKYQSMQRLGGANAIAAEKVEQDIAQSRLAARSSRSFSKLDASVRRY